MSLLRSLRRRVLTGPGGGSTCRHIAAGTVFRVRSVVGRCGMGYNAKVDDIQVHILRRLCR